MGVVATDGASRGFAVRCGAVRAVRAAVTVVMLAWRERLVFPHAAWYCVGTISGRLTIFRGDGRSLWSGVHGVRCAPCRRALGRLGDVSACLLGPTCPGCLVTSCDAGRLRPASCESVNVCDGYPVPMGPVASYCLRFSNLFESNPPGTFQLRVRSLPMVKGSAPGTSAEWAHVRLLIMKLASVRGLHDVYRAGGIDKEKKTRAAAG